MLRYSAAVTQHVPRTLIITAMMFGAAVCSMHYVGIEAAVFLPDADCRFDPTQNNMGIALLVLVGLWRRSSRNKAEDDIQGLPPLNVKFNLDLPEHDHIEPVERAYIHDVASHQHDSHAHDPAPAPSPYDVQALRPTLEMPNISLDLDEPDTSASPYQVRIDLADELWNLGQLHTSKALMEEVATEASGRDKEKALQWLAERG
jgi:hypothetical protein